MKPDPQWQPIETAPRDGAKILTWSPKIGCREAYYSSGEWQDIDVILDGEWEPTHWQPLQEPPETTS